MVAVSSGIPSNQGEKSRLAPSSSCLAVPAQVGNLVGLTKLSSAISVGAKTTLKQHRLHLTSLLDASLPVTRHSSACHDWSQSDGTECVGCEPPSSIFCLLWTGKDGMSSELLANCATLLHIIESNTRGLVPVSVLGGGSLMETDCMFPACRTAAKLSLSG